MEIRLQFSFKLFDENYSIVNVKLAVKLLEKMKEIFKWKIKSFKCEDPKICLIIFEFHCSTNFYLNELIFVNNF